MTLLRANNTLLNRQLPGLIFADEFQRPDGPIGNGWTDAYDLHGAQFWEPTLITDGQVQVEARFPEVTADPGITVGTQMAARRFPGLTDNFEVAVRWDWGYNTDAVAKRLSSHVSCYEVPGDVLNQISPVCFVDLETTRQTELGVAAIWDIGVAIGYFVNAFRFPQDVWGDEVNLYGPPPSGWAAWQIAQPNTWGGLLDIPFRRPPNPRSEWITIRCVNQKMMWYWNGKPLCGRKATDGTPAELRPWDVPAWAVGRDWFGFKTIAIDWIIGQNYNDGPGGTLFGTAPVTQHFKARIGAFYVREYNGPLL